MSHLPEEANRIRPRSQGLTAVSVAGLVGVVMVTLSWTPSLATGRPAPAAIAHHDDMATGPAREMPPRSTDTERPRGRETESVRVSARDREPVSLVIPELGVDSPISRTGMDGTGSIIVPEDVMATGWFDGSRRLGAAYGSTVIVGHRDSATQGTGALFAIEELPVDSSITVISRDGTEHEFAVESVELIDKTALPSQATRIFTRHGTYRLVLITCGGAFDEGARSYLSNVVITALPVPAGRD